MRLKAILCCGLAAAASGQQLGHYLQGATGLNSAVMPPPGVYLTYLPYLWRINSLKGPGGNTVADVHLNSWANIASLTFVVPDKLHAFDFGFSVWAPWASQRVQGNELPVDRRLMGYSDTFVIPFIFGWKKGAASFMADYAFVAPTGSYDPNSAANRGLGMWTHMFQAGTTVALGESKMWNASVFGTGEFHAKKKGRDLYVGPGMTIEYGVGRHFRKGLINVGAAGHYYQKLSADGGTDVGPLIRGLKDRAFGLGPEFQMIFLKPKVSFTARYEPQFGVRNRVRGDIFVVSLTYLGTFH